MGLVISSIGCFHQRAPVLSDQELSDEKYKRFYSKHGCPPCQVVMQLTGDGLMGGSSPFHVNEHVSIRYHYQYQCTFAPNDDSTIIYGVAVEHCNNEMQPLSKKDKFRAFKRSWDLSSTHTATTVTRHSTITSGPWSMSPNGKYLGCQATKLWREEDMFSARADEVASDTICCGFVGVVNEYCKLYPQSCPFSADGTMLACAFQNRNGLRIAILQPVTLEVLHTLKVMKQLKGFQGTVGCLAFSRDSSYLAVVSSRGQVYFLRPHGLKLRYFIETEDVIYPLQMLDPSISEPSSLEFDPRFPHEMFATCTFYRGLVKIWKIVKPERSRKRETITPFYSIHFPMVVNVIKYSTEGDILAVGCNEGIITCINPDHGTVMFKLHTAAQVPEFHSKAGIYHLAFTRTGEQLVASYSDGFIRLWQLPVNINLQNLCRLVINESVPESKVHLLPLPSKIKKFLLYRCY